MNKAIYVIPFFMNTLFAQVPNHSFENWTGFDPDDWQTTNIPIVPQSITPDTEAYSGSYSVRGTVVTNNFSQPFPPYLGYSGPSAQGFHISVPYSHFEGYYKLNLLYGDKFTGTVHIYNSNYEPIGSGQIARGGVVSQWQQFSIDINYDSIDIDMTCAVFFTITDSTGTASGHEGSTFLLDYLSMSGFAIAGIPEVSGNQINIYPNPASNFIHTDLGFSASNYSIYETGGRLIRESNFTNDEIEVNDLKAGMYFVVIRSKEKNYCGRILISR